MAIADAEPKKSDVDVTCTGSSSGTDMKPLHRLVKYSALKDFSFSVPDVWDNINIRIFIECCHSNIEELKNHSSLEENKVWEKIAKSGLERGGSITCFNVNYCLELAKCLESFVSKNETKMMDNEIFKRLYEDVVDLLPYFSPVNSKRPRSRSKSVESNSVEKIDPPPLIQSEQLVYSPFQTHSEHSQAIRVIADILKKYHTEDFMTLSSRSTLWKEVSDCIDKKFGVQVNPKKFLESFKKGVARSVRLHSDPQTRAKSFLEQVDAILPFFDLITPHSIKKADFLNLNDVSTGKVETTACESTKRRSSSESTIEKSEISIKSMKLRHHPTSVSTGENCTLNIVSSSTASVDDNCEKSSLDDEQKNIVSDVTTVSPSKSTATPKREEEVKSPGEGEEPCPVSPPKKRGRKRKIIPSNLVSLRKMSLRHSSSLKKTEKALEASSGKVESTIPQQTPAVIPSTKEIVLASRIIPTPKKRLVNDHDMFFEGSSSSRSEGRRHDNPHFIPLVETPPVTAESGNDSEIEDVPLMGTNIRVHTRRGNIEHTKFHLLKGNMNPIVLLDKIPAESLRKSMSSRRGRRPSQRSVRGTSRTRSSRNSDSDRSLPTRPTPSPQPEISTTVETAVVRRRGRPRGSSNIRVTQRSSMRFSSPESPLVNSTDADLVRSLAIRSTPSQSSSSYMSRDLVRPQYSFPSSSTAIDPYDFNSAPTSQSNAPEWFERFVIETRRHEVWKVHQMMKMQQDLLEAECTNKKVLDQILATLNDRGDRI